MLTDKLFIESTVEEFESIKVCRFCALENVDFIAATCVPNSTITRLFERVTHIRVSYFF